LRRFCSASVLFWTTAKGGRQRPVTKLVRWPWRRPGLGTRPVAGRFDRARYRFASLRPAAPGGPQRSSASGTSRNEWLTPRNLRSTGLGWLLFAADRDMAWTKEQIARRLADIAEEKRRLFRLLEGAANEAERRRLNWGRGDLQIEESEWLARLRRVSDR
jgi:hypothetical protein